MDQITKVGRRGVVTLPKEIRDRAGLREGDTLIAHLDPDGGISLRRAAVLPLREYGEEELAAFREEDRMNPELAEKLEKYLER